MVDVWPATLPQILLVDGFGQDTGETRVRYKPDRGPAQVRGGSSAAVDLVRGVMDMESGQWDDLQAFGRVTLLNWSLPFTFPDPGGSSDLLVRFGEKLPSRGYTAPDVWRVMLDLEILP